MKSAALNNHKAAVKGLALVVDDAEANRVVLEALLKKEGYRTISAVNGEQAVELFGELHPDIVFMDDMMPVMDGCEATSRIKAMAGTRFVPVIFVTAMSEGDALVRCIEAGGDEFLSKPFKQEILAAKIKAMERIRDLSRTVDKQHQKIREQHSLMLKEQVVAEQIYNRAITADNVASKYINSMLRAVSIFSGDMLLTSDCPDGRMYVLLGDFTGHGLTAAVGVLPAAEVFRAMTGKGFSAMEILQAINAKLNRLLPTGMFMTACFVVIEADMQSVSIWNAGMPEVLILSESPNGENRVKHRVVSQHLPLGILKNMEADLHPVTLDIARGDRILLCSDGLSEAINARGEEFGMQRYEQVATDNPQSFHAVVGALGDFCGNQEFYDDVSLVEIQCQPGLLKVAAL